MAGKFFASSARAQARDSWGREVFSAGETGAVHVRAHALLDRGLARHGHRELGGWLATHDGTGSAWLHLHFHMALFELALGDWQSAYRRWNRELFPAAVDTQDAPTDACGLLWRLTVTARESLVPSWQALRPVALARLAGRSDPFVALHDLLTLAGAQDAHGIAEWRARVGRDGAERPPAVLADVADALLALAQRHYAAAAHGIARLLPRLPRLGGSRAQLELFGQIVTWCRTSAVAQRATRRLAA